MANKKKSTVLVVRTAGGVQKKGGRKRSRGKGGLRSAYGVQGDPSTVMTAAYFKSLVNPFEYSPPKLGWGCMIPSTIVQAYIRTSVTASTDGSLLIYVIPCVTAGVIVGNGGINTAPVSSSNFFNSAAIIANCGEGRIVSVGLRAVPDIALTSVPGAVYTGATVPSTFAALSTLTPNDFTQLPTSHMSRGLEGGSSTGRPIDPDSFTFFAPVVDSNGWESSANMNSSIPFSVPYISFAGLPASAVVYYEAVINIEATQAILHNSGPVLPDSDGTSSRLCDYWPSFESMYNRLQLALPHPGRPGEAAAATDSSFLGALMSGVRSASTAVARAASSNLGQTFIGLAKAWMGGGAFGGMQPYGRQYAGYLQ